MFRRARKAPGREALLPSPCLVRSLPAGRAFAEETEAASVAEVAQCWDLLAIVRDSLVKEVDVPCAHSAAYIRERLANRSDDCDTLLEVKRRLRALPPKR